MALHFSFDSSEPEWWVDGKAMPTEDWTVEGDLRLRGPDGQWVILHFREGCPTANLVGIVTATDPAMVGWAGE